MLFRLRQIQAFNVLIDDEELLEIEDEIEDLDKEGRKLKQGTAEEQRQLAIDTRVSLFNSRPEVQSQSSGRINLICGGLPNDDQDEATIPDSAFKALLRKNFKLGCVGDNVVRPNKFNFLMCDCPDLMMERIQVYMSSGNCQACQLWYYDAKDNMRNFDNLTLDSRGDLLNLPMSMLPKQKKKEQNNPKDTSLVEQTEKKLLKWLGQNENTKLDDIPKEARMKMMEKFLKEQKNVSKNLGDPKGSKKHNQALFVTEKMMELEKATSETEQEELKRHFPVDDLDELLKMDVFTAEERQNLLKLSEECKVLQLNQKASKLSLSDKLTSEGITAEAAESTQFVVEALSKIASKCDIAKIEEIKKHFPFLNYWIEMNHLVIDTSRIPEDKMDELCEFLVNKSNDDEPDTGPVDQNTTQVVFTQEDFRR